MAYPVFDLHCDTADRIGWATLDLDLRFTAGTDGYFPGDETHPQDFDLIEGNACAISLAKIGNTPWAQCFATFVPDEIPTAHAARFQAQIMAHIEQDTGLRIADMVDVFAGPSTGALSALRAAGFFGDQPSRPTSCPQGAPGPDGAPKPVLVMPNGAKSFSRIKSSHALLDTFSIIAPATT